MVEFARNPYVSLVFMFVFAPYFATTVIGDPVRGQQIWSLSYTIASAAIAVIAPILGAVVDRMGSRKPWIVGSVLIMAPLCWLLWFAMPGGRGGLPVYAIAAIVVLLMVAYECGSVAHNALLPAVADERRLGRLSGLGLGAGATGSVSAQIIVLFGIVLPATHVAQWPWLPAHPLFGLDAAAFEHARVVGPIAALWMTAFIVPLLLWTRDTPPTGIRVGEAVAAGLRQLRDTLRHARSLSNVSLFLGARMLFNDATLAIQAYCGIYAAGVFGWGLDVILVFAFILSIFCILGGFLGALLDARYGSRTAILLSLVCTCLAVLVAISVTPTQIFFIPYDAAHSAPLWSFPYFRTLPELIYLTMYVVLAVTITAILANSRALLARIAPLSMMSQFFGLYALSGTATAFLGHGMVALFTTLFHSQRAGIASLLILLCGGLLLMTQVREQRAPDIARVPP